MNPAEPPFCRGCRRAPAPCEGKRARSSPPPSLGQSEIGPGLKQEFPVMWRCRAHEIEVGNHGGVSFLPLHEEGHAIQVFPPALGATAIGLGLISSACRARLQSCRTSLPTIKARSDFDRSSSSRTCSLVNVIRFAPRFRCGPAHPAPSPSARAMWQCAAADVLPPRARA